MSPDRPTRTCTDKLCYSGNNPVPPPAPPPNGMAKHPHHDYPQHRARHAALNARLTLRPRNDTKHQHVLNYRRNSYNITVTIYIVCNILSVHIVCVIFRHNPYSNPCLITIVAYTVTPIIRPDFSPPFRHHHRPYRDIMVYTVSPS